MLQEIIAGSLLCASLLNQLPNMRSDIGLQGERVDQDLLGIEIFPSFVELVSMKCPACTEEKNAGDQNSLGSDFSSRSYFLFGLS